MLNSKIEYAPNQVIVIGTSAGGMSALNKLLSQLQPDFPVPILVVQHISADAAGNALINSLNKATTLNCMHATNGAGLLPGHVYLAPSDHHMMIDVNQKLLITKGAHENRSRPAINPLFRSAGVAFGSGVIGILLPYRLSSFVPAVFFAAGTIRAQNGNGRR